MKFYPALDVRCADTDLLYAVLDDFAPTAFEERQDVIRAFFAAPAARDAALSALSSRFDAAAIDVLDDDWARRSQENLTPIRVGRLLIAPPWARLDETTSALVIIIEPSMGFGTGHHATTRLCLSALQELDLRDQSVLDVGTGSGILAIAAARLGAAHARGIDADPDALQSARRNLTLNRLLQGVSLDVADVTRTPLPRADVITANLTGGLLARSAPALLAATNDGGRLILSGLLEHEYDEVRSAFGTATVVWEGREEGWVGLVVKKL